MYLLKVIAALTLLPLLSIAGTCVGSTDGVDGADDVTTADGVYAKAQAKNGAALYEQHCLVCHDKKYFRPVLKRWNSQTAATLFDVMAGSMPESNPGGLLDDEYLDILAYIFSRSRYPDSDQVLTMAALPGIIIEDP